MPRMVIKDEKSEYMAKVTKKIKHILLDKDMTQLMLADKIGMDSSLLCRKLNNPRRLKFDDLYNIAKALKVPIEEIIGGDKK